MRKKSILLVLLPLLLVSCNGNSSEISSSQTSSGTTSHKEGLYSKLTKAIANMGDSFTADGSLTYVYYDGSSTTQTDYTVDIEVGKEDYYYEEQALTADNPTVIDNYFKTLDGKLGHRSLDYTTNRVVESYFDTSYDDTMVNEFPSLNVKNLKVIRDQPNWYDVKDYSIASSFVSFLTGYTVGLEQSLSLSQLAIHFDGDNFDQFYILLEYEEEYDESSSMMEQYLFQLDISNIGNTSPKELTPFEETANHDSLTRAFNKFARAESYTMNFAVNYEDASLTDFSYDYYLDFKNNYLLSLEERTGVQKVTTTNPDTNEEEDDYVPFKYNLGLKGDANGNPYSFYFDTTTHEVLRQYDYNDYWGYKDPNKLKIQNLFAYVGLVDPYCYQSIGNNTFTPYKLQDVSLVGLRSLLPFTEWTTADLTIKVDENDDLILYLSQKVVVSVSDMNYVQTNCTTTVTFKDINSTVIPDYLINAQINA